MLARDALHMLARSTGTEHKLDSNSSTRDLGTSLERRQRLSKDTTSAVKCVHGCSIAPHAATPCMQRLGLARLAGARAAITVSSTSGRNIQLSWAAWAACFQGACVQHAVVKSAVDPYHLLTRTLRSEDMSGTSQAACSKVAPLAKAPLQHGRARVPGLRNGGCRLTLVMTVGVTSDDTTAEHVWPMLLGSLFCIPITALICFIYELNVSAKSAVCESIS